MKATTRVGVVRQNVSIEVALRRVHLVAVDAPKRPQLVVHGVDVLIDVGLPRRLVRAMRADKVLFAVVHVLDVTVEVALAPKLLLADLTFVRLQAQMHGVVVHFQTPCGLECRIALGSRAWTFRFLSSFRNCNFTCARSKSKILPAECSSNGQVSGNAQRRTIDDEDGGVRAS